MGRDNRAKLLHCFSMIFLAESCFKKKFGIMGPLCVKALVHVTTSNNKKKLHGIETLRYC